MQKRFFLARAAMMLLLAVVCAKVQAEEADHIVVVSDTHVMAPSLLPDGAETQEAWTTYYAGQRKMLQQSATIFDQFIQNMIALQPMAVLIAGDLTKDGEEASHEYVRDGLESLRDNGIKVYVVPGNHDFGDTGQHTQFNADGTTANAPVLEYSAFPSFYYNFGYNGWDNELDPNSLSYMSEITEGLVLLAIDSHTAAVSAATLEWLVTKAKEKRDAGKQVIAMMHHPLFPHIVGADTFIDTYTVGDYETVRNALIEAGVNVILTGHFHTSDTAKDWNDDESKAVYDINTGSLIAYPCDYRILTPSADKMTLGVATQSLVPNGMTADECKVWLQGRIKTLAKAKISSNVAAAYLPDDTKEQLAEVVANGYIVHAEGDEPDNAASATLLAQVDDNTVLSSMLGDSFHSMLEDKSNYGTDKQNVTADRTLSIPMPEVGQEDVVTIGTAQTSTNQLPTNQYYKYGFSQQIYTSSEINHAAGYISSIAFHTVNGPSTRNLTIYMTHTAKESFDSNKDFAAITDADIVFSGNVTFAAGQWNTIDLDSPFSYDGTSNIIVAVDDNTGSYASANGLTHYVFGATGQAVYVYYDGGDLDPMTLSYPSYITPKLSDSKNQIQLGFETHPKPSDAKVSEVGDVSARVSCTLLGATAWNLRYRQVAGEGEEEQEWTTQNGITDPSFLITGLTAMTTYEAQLQAVYEGDILSGWTKSLVFTTNCCPVEEQAEIIYAVNSNYSDWYGYAIQFVDITDEEHPVEVAYINPPGYDFTGGTLTLCCGHQYKVNWIYDSEHSNVIGSYSLSLYFEPGDLFYSMARGSAPAETAELTTFIMDCTPYCAQKPQNVSVAGTTYNSATVSFRSETKTGEVVYSTEAAFNPDTATPASVTYTEVSVDPANASLTLTGLEPLTEYYVSVRNLCVDGVGHSRWSDPVKVTTGSRYDAPSQVTAKPVNSRTEQLSWSARGTEKSHNLYYRAQAAGTAVDPSAVQTFGGGNGTGFDNGSWGEGIWSSSGTRPYSNTVFVSGVAKGSSFGFKAGQGKTGAGQTKFLYGMQKLKKDGTPLEQMKKFDKKCLNDADRAAIIKELQNKIKELTDEQQIAAYNAEIEELNSLPTDAQKLEQMRTLEKNIEDNVAALDALALKNANGEITDEEFKSQSDVLKAQNALYGAELSELRAITINAEDPNNDGFAISSKEKESNQSRRLRAPENATTYIFFIRHNDPNGVLLVKDLTITPPEQVNDWIKVPNISGTEYTLTGLTPETAYEVMVEPVYEDGTTGTQSAITVFTTLGAETEPTEGEFSVSASKKVQFARGNLRYSGDSYGYEAEWSMAKQQYDTLGEANIRTSGSNTYLADSHDLFCWSTVNNYYGVSSYSYDDDPGPHFLGDFVDWGTDEKLVSDLGSGWSTLSKDEWSYLLNERENAATKKAVATITLDAENSVKGLLLLPDDWTAPDGAPVLSGSPVEMTLEQWTLMETAGAVFLPAAGQLTSVYEDYKTTTTLTPAGTYWTSTPSDDASGLKAMTLLFDNENVTLATDLHRRVMTAVRLVKAVGETIPGDANGDGAVTITDAVAIVNYILGNPSAGFNKAAADVSGDGNISITDAVGVVNIILTQ